MRSEVEVAESAFADNDPVPPSAVLTGFAEREVDNLQDFMRKEHMSDETIERTMEKVDWRTNGVMRKNIIRWRCRYDERKHLPYIIDRWRQYVQMRKLVRLPWITLIVI